MLPETKQVAVGNQRGNAGLMSPVHFHTQYKNQSLALLNALKVKVSALSKR